MLGIILFESNVSIRNQHFILIEAEINVIASIFVRVRFFFFPVPFQAVAFVTLYLKFLSFCVFLNSNCIAATGDANQYVLYEHTDGADVAKQNAKCGSVNTIQVL